MKRSTLTRNLNEMINRVRSTFLPIDVLEVFIHGSYFRGDETPGDLDIFIVANVKDKWSEWAESFHTLSDHHNALWECYQKDINFSEAASSFLESQTEDSKIPKEWLTCVSWSDIFQSFLPYSLDWSKITKQLLTRGMKGVHIEILTTERFQRISGRLYTYQEMPSFLVWSVKQPENISLTPASDEFEIYLKLENERLLKDLEDARVRSKFGRAFIEKMIAQCPKDKLAIVAIRVLNNTAKYEVTEERLREELRKWSLPESLVYALKNRGSKTWYHLAETLEEQKELEQRAKLNSETSNEEKRILGILKEYVEENEGIHIDCRIRNLEKGWVIISIEKPGKLSDKEFRQIWEPRGFKIEKIYGPIFAEKIIVVLPGLSRSELQNCLIDGLRM
jgi:predicted nucleotidyltransferase